MRSHQAEVLSLKTALSAAESARRSTESEKAGLEELLEAVRAELQEAAVRRDGLMKRFTEAQKERLQADSAAQRQLEDRTTAFETERLQLEREWTERLEVLKRDLVRVASWQWCAFRRCLRTCADVHVHGYHCCVRDGWWMVGRMIRASSVTSWRCSCRDSGVSAMS